jgi:hypothetical protein
MIALRPIAIAITLVTLAAVLFGWTVREAGHQRDALEQALYKEALMLADSLQPGLVAASNAYSITPGSSVPSTRPARWIDSISSACWRPTASTRSSSSNPTER